MNPVELWMEHLHACYGLAYGERTNELNGTRTRTFDARGLHPLSHAWGAVEAMQDLEPILGQDGIACSPTALIRAAREDAQKDFVDALWKRFESEHRCDPVDWLEEAA